MLVPDIRRHDIFRGFALASLPVLLVACGSSSGSSAGATSQAPAPSSSSATTTAPAPISSSPGASAVPLPAQPGTVTIRETFADAKNHHFRTVSGSLYVVGVTGGKYRMLLKKPGLPHGELATIKSDAETVSIALTMTGPTTAAGSSYGPLCYYQQGLGFSLRVVDGTTWELISISMQGQVEETLATGELAAADGAGATHRLRLDCTWGEDSTQVVGWVDGVQVGPASDTATSLKNFYRQWAGIGFWATATDVPATVTVDDVVISEKAR